MALGVNALRAQIEQAKKNLQSVDENITKITGRDPNEPRVNQNERGFRSNDRGKLGTVRLGRRGRNVEMEEDEMNGPPAKRTDGVFRRIGPNPKYSGRRVMMGGRRTSQRERSPESEEEADEVEKKTVQSSVVSTAKEVKKSDIINAQNVDEKGKARNRRMFGMLLGTLARFQTDESKADQAIKQEQRRTEIEKRLEETMSQDRRQAAAERRELYTARKAQQRKINLLEQKVALASELESWEKEWEMKSKFIMTKASPPIFFLPKDTTGRTIRALKESSKRIEEKAEAGRSSMIQTLSEIDEEIRMLEERGKKKEDEVREVKVENTEGADALAEDPNVDINVDVEGVNDGGRSGGEGKSDLSESAGASDSDMFHANSQESVLRDVIKMEPETGSLNITESVDADQPEAMEAVVEFSIKQEAVMEDSENKSPISAVKGENGDADSASEEEQEDKIMPPSVEEENMSAAQSSSGSSSESEVESQSPKKSPEKSAEDKNSVQVENNDAEEFKDKKQESDEKDGDADSEPQAGSKVEDQKGESGGGSSSEESDAKEDIPQKDSTKPTEVEEDKSNPPEIKKTSKENRKPIRKRQPSPSSSSSSSSSEEEEKRSPEKEKNRRRRRSTKSPPRNMSRRRRKSEASPVRKSRDGRRDNHSSRRCRRNSSSSSSRSRSPVKSSRRRRDSRSDRKRRDSKERRRGSRSNSRSRYSRSSGRRR